MTQSAQKEIAVSDVPRSSTTTLRPPTDAPVRSFKPLKEGASDEQHRLALNELASAYATVAFALTSELPDVKSVLVEVRVEMAADRAERKRVDAKLDELGLGIAGVAFDVRHVSGRVTALEALMADIASARLVAANPKLSPIHPPSVPPMRRQMDSSAFLVETARRVGEAAKIKAQQIEDNPDTSLTPEVVGEIARAEVKEALAHEREDNRQKALQAVADKVENDRLAAVDLTKTKAKERRERNRLIVVGIVISTVMLFIGSLYIYAQGRLAERSSVVPVFVPVPSVTKN